MNGGSNFVFSFAFGRNKIPATIYFKMCFTLSKWTCNVSEYFMIFFFPDNFGVKSSNNCSIRYSLLTVIGSAAKIELQHSLMPILAFGYIILQRCYKTGENRWEAISKLRKVLMWQESRREANDVVVISLLDRCVRFFVYKKEGVTNQCFFL